MPKAIPRDIREEVIARCLQGESQTDISMDLGLHYRTVSILWRRSRHAVTRALFPIVRAAGGEGVIRRQSFARLPALTGREHPEWSADVIHQQLMAEFPGACLPSSRSLQRWFEVEGCNQQQGRPSQAHAQDSQAGQEDPRTFSMKPGYAWPVFYLLGEGAVRAMETPIENRYLTLEETMAILHVRTESTVYRMVNRESTQDTKLPSGGCLTGRR